MGFNELSLNFASKLSYREASKALNRVRNETAGTPVRTLSNIVELEGTKIQESILKKSKNILYDNNFSETGSPNDNNKVKDYIPDKRKIKLSSKIIQSKIEEYNRDKPDDKKIPMSEKENFYENMENTINISVDDVSVKKQKAERPNIKEKNQDSKKNYIRNTIVHIEKLDKHYCLNASSTVEIIPQIVSFLLFNNELKNYLQFFVDGEKSLHNAIINRFSWFGSFNLLLDWYHLSEKCKMELSSGLNKKDIRNEILTQIEEQLWIGKINQAISILKSIDKCNIKSESNIDRLIGYFERNRNYIPCYALRKSLGLRNSSNKGEKSNDLLVANRQKHNGMSWSNDGSIALTTITTLHRNSEEKTWFENEEISFKFIS